MKIGRIIRYFKLLLKRRSLSVDQRLWLTVFYQGAAAGRHKKKIFKKDAKR